MTNRAVIESLTDRERKILEAYAFAEGAHWTASISGSLGITPNNTRVTLKRIKARFSEFPNKKNLRRLLVNKPESNGETPAFLIERRSDSMPQQQDTQTRLLATPDQADALADSLKEAAKIIRKGIDGDDPVSVKHVHQILEQSVASGPWRLIISVANQ